MRITSTYLNQIVREEINNECACIILKKEERRIKTLHENMKTDQLLVEFGLADIGHLALDVGGVVGDIFPGAGGFFDIANAAWYANKGEHLMAAMSVIGMIPYVGDAVGKVGAYTMKLGGKKAAGWLVKLLSKHMPKITTFFKSLSKNPKIAKFIDPMMDSIKGYIKDATENPEKSLQGLQKAISAKPSEEADPKKVDAAKKAIAQAEVTDEDPDKAQPQGAPAQAAPAGGATTAYSKPPGAKGYGAA